MYSLRFYPASAISRRRSALQRAVDEGDRLPDFVLLFHPLLHQLAGVQDRAVIAPAESFADLIERRLRQLAREIHRDLARESDVGRATFSRHVGEAHIEV